MLPLLPPPASPPSIPSVTRAPVTVRPFGGGIRPIGAPSFGSHLHSRYVVSPPPTHLPAGENDYMQYEPSKNSTCWKNNSLAAEQDERDHHGLSEEQDSREDHALTDEYEYPFHDVPDLMGGQDATENLLDAPPLKGYDANRVHLFKPTFHPAEQSGQRRFNLMHMQSARSSLKSSKHR